MQRVHYQISLYSPHESRKVGRRVRKRHQEFSGDVGILERTKDGTNKMRDLSKRPNYSAKVILYLLGSAASSTIGQTKLNNLTYDLTYSSMRAGSYLSILLHTRIARPDAHRTNSSTPA